MNVLKLERVEIRKPYFDPNPHKSKTNNHDWRKGLFLVFKDKFNNLYWYMPKWDEFVTMINSAKQIDELNSLLARCKK